MAEKTPPKKRGRKPILDPELVAAALVELQGNVAAVAKRYGVDRTSVRDLIDKRQTLQRVCRDAREGMLDNAESALYRAVIAGEAWAVCFFLKCQGKSRGYIEKQEIVTESKGDVVNVELVTRILATLGARATQSLGPGATPEGDPVASEQRTPEPSVPE